MAETAALVTKYKVIRFPLRPAGREDNTSGISAVIPPEGILLDSHLRK